MKYRKMTVSFAMVLGVVLAVTSCGRVGFEYTGPYQNSQVNGCSKDTPTSFFVPIDNDGDGICDYLDQCFGDDATFDIDSDGTCNDRDTDDDGDGWSDLDEIECGTDSQLSSSVPDDEDGDSICDNLDLCSGDDSTGDIDADGVCNDSDTDDDNDGFADTDETVCGTDPLLSTSVPVDSDSDGVCDPLDLCLGDDATGDVDGDGTCNDLDTDNDADACNFDIDCDDLNACTVDRCQLGHCVSTPKDCQHVDDDCVEGVCDSVTGECRPTNKPDNTVCSDGFFCTVEDRCLSGVCVGYERDCQDNDPCTLDVCDEDFDLCQNPPGGAGVTETNTEDGTCYNGLDDDCDGLTDNFDPSCNDDWWNSDYLARTKLVFSNATQDEDLLDFPVLVVLDSSRVDYSKTFDQGQDIRFVDPENITTLSFEIEQWDETGTSLIWVKVPKIDGGSGQDFIWMYFNNPNATDAQSVETTWNDEYEAVYHLSDLLDSSGSQFHATNRGAFSTDGSIAGGYGAQGDNGYVDLGSARPLLKNTSSFTISTWLLTSSASDQALVSVSVFNGENPTNKSRALLHSNPDFTLKLGARADDSQSLAHCVSSASSLEQDTWHYVVGVVRYDLGTLEIYVDGELDAYDTKQFSLPCTSDTEATRSILGIEEDLSGCPLSGLLDEVRIQNTARSADWIRAQYQSMTDNFITFQDQ